MAVKIKFFASLKESMNIADSDVDSSKLQTAKDAWNQVTQNKPIPANLLCAVNHQHVPLTHHISDGDEIAFFPPVTGG